MSEQEKMDTLLRRTMSVEPPPRLSSQFDQRLAKRLRRPRRLDSFGRWVMILYAILATVLSVAVMRSQSLGWISIAVAVLAPLVIIGVVRPWRGRFLSR